MPKCTWDGPHYCECHERLALAVLIVEAARDVLAVRGKDFERSPLPAYMERPFSVLSELLRGYDAKV